MKHTFSMNTRTVKGFAHQQGASLLEGIAYLGIAAIIIMGAISLFSSTSTSAESNRATTEIIGLRTAVKKLYMGQANYGTTSLNSSLVSAKAVPSSLSTTAPGTITNSWGGAVTVTGATANFTISYGSVSQEACINIISGANGWSTIAVNGTTVGALPASPATAATRCNNATNNTILFTTN